MADLSQEEEIRMELRAACSSYVNKLLLVFAGPTILDTVLLSNIKKISVKGPHKEVHFVNFGKTKQGDRDNVLIEYPCCIMQHFSYLLM